MGARGRAGRRSVRRAHHAPGNPRGQRVPDRNLFKLSGGEKQKIACASVSAHDPQLLVLDEPASNLDVASIRMLASIVAQWKAEGRTVVVAEHRLGYLLDVADRFVLVEDGRVAWEKTASA